MAEEFDLEALEPTLSAVVESDTLEWIFVGGKGGVGKTTTSCCLSILLAQRKEKVLLISTDPAHNISDALKQKVGKDPTPVAGVEHLWAMEIEPKMDAEMERMLEGSDSPLSGMFSELSSSMPGVDEAMGFLELIKAVQKMDYDCIVFDTAPTGHTLRLFSFPRVMDASIAKIGALSSRFGGLMSGLSGMLGADEGSMMGKIDAMRGVVDKVRAQFADPDKTTFVAVCIPEFLSVYETERLVQELAEHEVDVSNVVVNQVLIPEADTCCSKCLARKAMQEKYLRQIYDLYAEDFHVVVCPLLGKEVRGIERLTDFSDNLMSKLEYPFAEEEEEADE